MTQKSNLIFVVSSAIGKAGGADRATMLLAEQYNKMGYKVSVFATSCEHIFEKDIYTHGPYINKGHRFKAPQISLFLKILLFSFIKKPKFIHTIGLTYEIRLLLKFLHSKKIVVWETTEAKPNNKFVDKHIHKYLKNAALVLAPSKTIAANFKATFNYQKPIEILPFWVEWREPLELNHIRTGKLLYVGRMDKDKGIDTIIHALAALPVSKNIELDICGRGDSSYISSQIKDNHRINILGWVDDNTLAMHLSKCDFLILPSLHEGYPLTLIESCSYGKPIIATKVGSIPEVFNNTGAGLLFSPGNYEELSQLIVYCYEENQSEYQLRCKMARALYDKINSISNIQLKLNIVITKLVSFP